MKRLARVVALWVVVTACSAYDATLTWEPVLDSRVKGYDLGYGTASRNYSSTVQTTDSHVGVFGLQNGVRYFFAVKACTEDRSECSVFSDEINYARVERPNTLHIAWTGVVNAFRAEVTLAWGIDTEDDITFLVCAVLKANTCQWDNPTAATAQKFISLVLVPNKTYKATVRSVMNGNLSAESNTLVFTTKRVTLKNK